MRWRVRARDRATHLLWHICVTHWKRDSVRIPNVTDTLSKRRNARRKLTDEGRRARQTAGTVKGNYGRATKQDRTAHKKLEKWETGDVLMTGWRGTASTTWLRVTVKEQVTGEGMWALTPATFRGVEKANTTKQWNQLDWLTASSSLRREQLNNHASLSNLITKPVNQKVRWAVGESQKLRAGRPVSD